MNNNNNKILLRGFEFGHCSMCGNLRALPVGGRCADCWRLEVVKLNELRDFLEAHPDKNITETAEAVGIPVDRIVDYMGEGRITVTPGLDSQKLCCCTACNKPISTGNMCADCRLDFNEGVQRLKEESLRKNSSQEDGNSRRNTEAGRREGDI